MICVRVGWWYYVNISGKLKFFLRLRPAMFPNTLPPRLQTSLTQSANCGDHQSKLPTIIIVSIMMLWKIWNCYIYYVNALELYIIVIISIILLTQNTKFFIGKNVKCLPCSLNQFSLITSFVRGWHRCV